MCWSSKIVILSGGRHDGKEGGEMGGCGDNKAYSGETMSVMNPTIVLCLPWV